jgi:hypothetical protein
VWHSDKIGVFRYPCCENLKRYRKRTQVVVVMTSGVGVVLWLQLLHSIGTGVLTQHMVTCDMAVRFVCQQAPDRQYQTSRWVKSTGRSYRCSALVLKKIIGRGRMLGTL